MRNIVFIAHNIRSTHNVGSLLRTCEGLGVEKLFLTGYSPFPILEHNDPRLPHQRRKIADAMHKTALGAQNLQAWEQHDDVEAIIASLRTDGYSIAGLEQSPNATQLPNYKPSQKIAILLGEEVAGINPNLQKQCDILLEIPMFGQKESFNVVQAAAMIGYHCRFL